jgi:plastocyanin
MDLTSGTGICCPTNARSVGRLALLLSGFLLAGACGTAPSAPSDAAATITIGPAGLFPSEVRIKAWNRVAFVNNDTRPHTIASDPVDIHTECPPLNQVGLLNPGETRTTGTLNLPGLCHFHDHQHQTDSTLMGRIVVQ